MNAYHERKYEEIADFIKENHSILLFGPRGSGKTVFLRHVLTELSPKRIINLLDADLYLRYSKDPGRFSAEIQHELEQLSQSTPHYIMVDEVQRLPELLNQVQLLLDEYGSEKLVFILTGSSARKLTREDANLLAGRALAFDFFPFSSNEVDFNRNLDSILQWGLSLIHI